VKNIVGKKQRNGTVFSIAFRSLYRGVISTISVVAYWITECPGIYTTNEMRLLGVG
jgi:hypothetical protein